MSDKYIDPFLTKKERDKVLLEAMLNTPVSEGGNTLPLTIEGLNIQEIWDKWQSDKKQMSRFLEALRILGVRTTGELNDILSDRK